MFSSAVTYGTLHFKNNPREFTEDHSVELITSNCLNRKNPDQVLTGRVVRVSSHG